MKNSLDLTTGSVVVNLSKFTIPIIFTLLLQMAYGTADLLIVGQFSSVAEVSATSIGSQLLETIISLISGLAMGTTILVGRFLGAKENEKASKVIGTSLILFAFIAIIMSIFLLTCNNIIAEIMNTPPEAFASAKSYLKIIGIGSIFTVAYNLIGSIFRGLGDSKTPLIAVSISCVANILLDLLLVGNFHMGAKGAAIATVSAQGISVFLSLLVIRRVKLPFPFSKNDIKLNAYYIKNIIRLGIPVAIQGFLVGVSFLAITAIVNVFGVSASAGVGIVEKITMIIMVVPLAFMQSLSAFTAQNVGAGKVERGQKGLKFSIILSLAFGIVLAYLSAFHGNIFTILFTSDEATTAQALLYLKSYAIDTILVCFIFSFSGYFNGLGKTTFVMLQAVLAAFLIRIPLAYYFSTLENTSLFLIGLATPSATLIQIIACTIFYFKIKKKSDILY